MTYFVYVIEENDAPGAPATNIWRKIGRTKDVPKRVKDLTGGPRNIQCVFKQFVQTSDAAVLLEARVHSALRRNGHVSMSEIDFSNPNREWFDVSRLDAETIIANEWANICQPELAAVVITSPLMRSGTSK